MTWGELKTKYEVGSNIACKVKYKNTQFNEVVIDFDGFDGILKLEDISISISLAEDLFSIINKGDSFNAVVVGFDNVKQRVILNTKVFRNALDDVLPLYHCVNIVEDNYKRRRSLPNNFLLEQRKILDRLRGDLSSNELTFLYELIQNAVDHPNKNFNNVSVHFEVFKNYLLVKHNGALFTENNFESITGILYGEQTQEGERNRIGYKGIGFKSVFRFTDNAYVRSGNFSFRFSKEESGSDKPWEVLPLFQYESDMVAHIPKFDFFNAPVAFAFEFNSVNSRNYVIKYLNQLSQNPYLLIFLENLTQLKIKAPSLTYFENGVSQSFPNLEVDFFKQVGEKDEFDSINLWVNNSSHSEWLIHTKNDIVISDEEVINELLNESVTAVPAKMRNFRTPKVTIALPKKANEGDVINLFTYLPLSNSKFKLPFLVNADFIPDLDRTDIIHNLKYNDEILKFVAAALQELSQKLAQYNQFEYLNTLLPDLGIDYQGSGNVIVKRLLDFLPQTKITYNGQDLSLSNIAIDKTGFTNSFGLEIFNSLIDENNVPLSIISEFKKISKLIEKIYPDNVFDFNKLREKIRSQSFKDWLKNSSNNGAFIKYLIISKCLDEFSDELIYLAQDGDLYKGADLLLNLGADNVSLEWLDFKKVLHKTVLSDLSALQLPLSQYEPIPFINDVICKDKKSAIIDALHTGSIQFLDFYSYLSKYATNPLFPSAEIKSFPIQTVSNILPNWSGLIYFNSNSISTLITDKALPTGLYHLLDDNWSDASRSHLKVLAEKLEVFSFLETEPFNFINTIISANKEPISRFYLSQASISINANASLWSFILSSFRNLSDSQKESISAILKAFPVLSKNGVFKELHTLYLPSEFTDNDALETLSLQFPNSNIDFVSADYLKHPSIDKNEIRTFFRRLDVKVDTTDFLQHKLLPNLNQISDDLFVPLTRLLYENRESEQIINTVLRNNQFKIKTKEGTFKPINECYVGSPYIDETQIPNPLSIVPVANQISDEYEFANTHRDAWQRFFSEKLKVSKLGNEADIISLKLKHISGNFESWKSQAVSILEKIYQLYKSGNLLLTNNNLSYIKKLPLLCKGEHHASFHTANSIHFSSAYKPGFDFEKIFGSECGVQFLSDLYKFEDSADLIDFFEKIGVTQYFDRNRHSAIYQNIPTADGQKKTANQLFKYELKRYVGQSNVAFEDLSKVTHNGRTLEDDLGFKSKLDVAAILNYIKSHHPDKRELRELIAQLLKVSNPNSSNDRIELNAFISLGELLSTAKSYNSVNKLYSIEESIRSGIRENEYLIDPLFNKQELELRKRYLTLFGIKTLSIDDFNPQFEGEHIDIDFTNRVNERLVFLAFDNDSEKYIETEQELREKFNNWKIKKCSKISLKYPAIDSKIVKEDNKNFKLQNDKTIYYIGSWIEQRNFLIVHWLKDNILNISKQLQFVQDILLNDPFDIIADFENKGRPVTEEIRQRFRIPQPTQQQVNVPESNQTEAPASIPEIKRPNEGEFDNPFKDITPDEETFIRSIITGDFELDEKLDANTTAKIKTLMNIKGQYSATEVSDEGRFLKAGSDEIIVRSAQNGLLYLDLYHWGRLSESNVSLSIYTESQIKIFKTQEDLIKHTKPLNKFGIVRMPSGYDVEDYNSLDHISDKEKWHFVLIVNENTKAAKSYKEIMDYSDPSLYNEDNF